MLQNCNKWRILQAFFLEPRTQFQIRQLSRKLNLAVTSVMNYLAELKKERFIMQSHGGVYKSYVANFNDDTFRFYKKIDTLIRISQSGLVRELSKAMPDCTVLFGSCAKGEDTEGSDMDIFVQAPTKEVNLKKYEQLLKRKIQLFFKEDFNKLPPELRNNIINGVVLYGYLKVF